MSSRAELERDEAREALRGLVEALQDSPAWHLADILPDALLAQSLLEGVERTYVFVDRAAATFIVDELETHARGLERDGHLDIAERIRREAIPALRS